MRPASELNSDELNREIARLSGWVDIKWQDLGYVRFWEGLPPESVHRKAIPDYLEWANAGKLLEEMVTNWGWEYAAWLVAKAAHKDDGTDYAPPDAIRHAYYEWKRGKDADTE